MIAAGGSPQSGQVARRLLRAGLCRRRNPGPVTPPQVRRRCCIKPVVQHGVFSTFSPPLALA
eukprot:scaffold36451_cov67-Phaeocystis_antarctica.AAC.4